MKQRFQQSDLEQIAGHLADIHQLVSDRLIPEASRAHWRRAEIEAMLGIRSWLDDKINRIGKEQRNSPFKASQKSSRQSSSQSIPIEEETD
ncbi:hypothetical protein [Paenibacillus sp. J2TS4]|uniref:hypothetical protein n=1 Tax=Paenibacillus sp. J2TS4 TaxID=2807194 RepID=UPI001B24F7FE|nr:hypothetical protein [Paenibacillus sp. J2TS4]GIP31860.1 hypothetical protein J2TS4_10700 [Paenibacillus sp. J2TS4]